MIKYGMDDTISAIATAVGEGGIGIIRVSGSQSLYIINKIFKGVKGEYLTQVHSHQVVYGHIIQPTTSKIVDEAVVLFMKAPHSYTKEDVVEIQCHGGAISLRSILQLTLHEGARLAEPGEFTKRAFLNGRIDLAQAEAVIDIIRAKTEASLRMSVGHLSGVLSAKIHALRTTIITLIAHVEASIDFPEDDIEEITTHEVEEAVKISLQEIADLLATATTGRILREGLETVIIGKPNVGKSSLLNALLRQQRAIVTNIPGTTRDIIEEFVTIRGIPLKMIDTAGIRETEDVVEKIGVAKAREFMAHADLILMVLDASETLSVEDREVLALLSARQAIILVNKSDLPAVLEQEEVVRQAQGKKIINISVEKNIGIDELEQEISDLVYSGQVSQGESAFVNNVRHTTLLRQVQNQLEAVLVTMSEGMPADCMVIDLKAAWETLGEITGETVGEDLVEQIFSQFCIGK